MIIRGRTIIASFLVVFLLQSCRLDKMFLVPYDLSTKDTIVYEDGFIHFDSQDSAVHLTTHPKRMYNLSSFFVESRSRNRLNGWWLRPTEAPKFTLLHFHGNAANLAYQIGAIDSLVYKGFQVFMVDYSGFGMSNGKASRENVYLDGQTMIDFVYNHPSRAETKFLLYGQSLGGHLAAVLGTENQNILDGIVIEGAFSSHSDIAAEAVPILGRIFTREMYSAKKSLPNLEKPLLVIHSTEDQTIPYQMAHKLYDSTKANHHLLTIDGCHICGPYLYADEIAQAIKGMFDSKD